MWDLGNTLSFLKTHFSRRNIITDPPAGLGPQGGAQWMAAFRKPELPTGNSTLGPEEAEIRVGPGTELPGTAVQDVLAEAGLGVTGAELDAAEPPGDEVELPKGPRSLTKRDTGAGLLAEFLAEERVPRGPSELGRVGRSSKQLASVPEGEPEARALRGQGPWLQVLEGDFSHLDVSLCVVLYSLSFMGLLAVYTYFRTRARALKGHAGHPAA